MKPCCNSGTYPNFLWLYKENLSELRQHFSFHPQLVGQVERWRQSIRAQLAGEVVFVYSRVLRTVSW